jgi:hypothetical protein
VPKEAAVSFYEKGNVAEGLARETLDQVAPFCDRTSRDACSAQAVEAEGAAGEHLVLRLGGQLSEPLAEHLRRAHEEAVLVRIIPPTG